MGATALLGLLSNPLVRKFLAAAVIAVAAFIGLSIFVHHERQLGRDEERVKQEQAALAERGRQDNINAAAQRAAEAQLTTIRALGAKNADLVNSLNRAAGALAGRKCWPADSVQQLRAIRRQADPAPSAGRTAGAVQQPK